MVGWPNPMPLRVRIRGKERLGGATMQVQVCSNSYLSWLQEVMFDRGSRFPGHWTAAAPPPTGWRLPFPCSARPLPSLLVSFQSITSVRRTDYRTLPAGQDREGAASQREKPTAHRAEQLLPRLLGSGQSCRASRVV